MIVQLSDQNMVSLTNLATANHLGFPYQPAVPNPDPKSSSVSGWNEGACLAILQKAKRLKQVLYKGINIPLMQ